PRCWPFFRLFCPVVVRFLYTGTVIATSPRGGRAALKVKTIFAGAVFCFRFTSYQLPVIRMCAHTGRLADERRPDPVNLYTLLAVIVQLICEVVGGANQVVFAWNKYAALFLNVGGKTPGISGSEYRIHCIILQPLWAFRVACHLAGKAAEFTPYLT